MSNGRKIYFNGEFVEEGQAKISIYDSALMFGDMVFEMTRSFNKVQFKLREHLERLYSGIKILQIPVQISIDEMEQAVHETIKVNDPFFGKDDEHRIMIDVTRGTLGIYQNVSGLTSGPNIVIADFPLRWTVAGMGKLFSSGINAVITSQRAIPAQFLEPKIKNRSRIHYLMANIEAARFEGNDNWALLLDQDGFIAEGTGDNFFIVKNNKVITPEGRNILRGISRDYVLNTLCEQLEIEAVEKNIEPYDVYTADEAFMTGTPFCMLPVTKLNGVPIGDGRVGNVFRNLLNQWSSNTGVNISDQILSWNNQDKDNNCDSPTPYSFKRK